MGDGVPTRFEERCQHVQEAKGKGNAAFSAGDLDIATSCYKEAMSAWGDAVRIMQQSQKLLAEGMRVSYGKDRFGMVMSVFPVMEEYFLKDLETDKPVWVGGQEGLSLQRFSREDLQAVSDELFDLRLAVAQNLAAVSLKGSNYADTVRWANAALAMHGRAPKALLRKGAALLRSDRAVGALEVLAVAADVSPTDREVQRLFDEAQRAAPQSAEWICAAGCIANCAGLLCAPMAAPSAARRSSTGSRARAAQAGGKSSASVSAQPSQATKAKRPTAQLPSKEGGANAQKPPAVSVPKQDSTRDLVSGSSEAKSSSSAETSKAEKVSKDEEETEKEKMLNGEQGSATLDERLVHSAPAIAEAAKAEPTKKTCSDLSECCTSSDASGDVDRDAPLGEN